MSHTAYFTQIYKSWNFKTKTTSMALLPTSLSFSLPYVALPLHLTLSVSHIAYFTQTCKVWNFKYNSNNISLHPYYPSHLPPSLSLYHSASIYARRTGLFRFLPGFWRILYIYIIKELYCVNVWIHTLSYHSNWIYDRLNWATRFILDQRPRLDPKFMIMQFAGIYA